MPQISDVRFLPIVIKLEQCKENKCSDDDQDDCNGPTTNKSSPQQSNISERIENAAHYIKIPVADESRDTNTDLMNENAENGSNTLKLPLNCDMNVENNNCVRSKPLSIAYSCHRCKSVFSSRTAFEIHYK